MPDRAVLKYPAPEITPAEMVLHLRGKQVFLADMRKVCESYGWTDHVQSVDDAIRMNNSLLQEATKGDAEAIELSKRPVRDLIPVKPEDWTFSSFDAAWKQCTTRVNQTNIDLGDAYKRLCVQLDVIERHMPVGDDDSKLPQGYMQMLKSKFNYGVLLKGLSMRAESETANQQWEQFWKDQGVPERVSIFTRRGRKSNAMGHF